MPENRNERLSADYRDMLRIQDRPYLSWIVTKGDAPYAEEYLLSVRLRSYVLSAADGRYIVSAIPRCTVRITLWDSYPYIAPYVRMLSMPPVFHPSWYSKGTYCPAEPWSPAIPLKDYVKRMLGTLRYEPSLIDSVSAANVKALDWFRKHRDDASLFPSDTAALTENDPDEIASIQKAALSFSEEIDSWPIR